MKKNYILFIDSGIGGLTTLSECVKILPTNYLYYADNINAPYGNHSKLEIYHYLKNIIDSLLLKYDIKIIVLACNTATTAAIDKLRKNFKNIFFVGTEPAIKLAEKFGFINTFCAVTPATSKQEKFKQLTKSTNLKTHLYTPKMLACYTENYFTNKSLLNFYKLNSEIIKITHLSKNYDSLILGCTHYVLLKEILSKQTNKPIIDGNVGVSNQVKKFYLLYSKKQIKPHIKFLFSSSKRNLKEIYKKIFLEILAKL